MIDLPNLGPEAISWGNDLVAKLRMMQPVILAALAVPSVLALLYRDPIAFLLSILLVGTALAASSAPPSSFHDWIIIFLVCLAGLLAVFQAARLRSSRRRTGEAETRVNHIKVELEAVREKLDRETYWRKAIEVNEARNSSQSEVPMISKGK